MADERFPEDILIGPQDLRRSGWNEAIAHDSQRTYVGMWQALSANAQRAIKDGRTREGKSLWLLADACSMRLVPRSSNEPYRPYFVVGNGRSPIPNDFTNDQAEFFAQIVDEIDDVLLRARLADLVWLIKEPRTPRFALLAIDAYRQIPLDQKAWLRDGRTCWQRALQLSRQLGKGAGNRLNELEAEILAALRAARPCDGFLAAWFAETLDNTRIKRNASTEIAFKLEQLASAFNEAGDIDKARTYFDAAAQWFTTVHDAQKTAAMLTASAETWAKEAMAQMAGENPSHMAGAASLERAIHAYRRVPNKFRQPFGVDECIAKLHRQMNEAAKKAITEMKLITSPVDLADEIARIQRAVTGKVRPEALVLFAHVFPGTQVAKLQRQALDSMRRHPLQSLIAATMISRDGRVVARRPGMDPGSEESPESKRAIRAETIGQLGMLSGIVVQACILPGLQVLLQEHRFTEAEFVAIAQNSPIVPPGRALLVGKGLFAGFELDFITAIHLLVPQVEHMVRWQLKLHNVKTTTLDSEGVETEVGLSALLEKEKVAEIFGEDLTFDLRAIFADPFGPNLRNTVVHGLLESGEMGSHYVVYAWWWCLKLVLDDLIAAQREALTPHESVSDEPDLSGPSAKENPS